MFIAVLAIELIAVIFSVVVMMFKPHYTIVVPIVFRCSLYTPYITPI